MSEVFSVFTDLKIRIVWIFQTDEKIRDQKSGMARLELIQQQMAPILNGSNGQNSASDILSAHAERAWNNRSFDSGPVSDSPSPSLNCPDPRLEFNRIPEVSQPSRRHEPQQQQIRNYPQASSMPYGPGKMSSLSTPYGQVNMASSSAPYATGNVAGQHVLPVDLSAQLPLIPSVSHLWLTQQSGATRKPLAASGRQAGAFSDSGVGVSSASELSRLHGPKSEVNNQYGQASTRYNGQEQDRFRLLTRSPDPSPSPTIPRFCHKCGKGFVVDDASYCSHCGMKRVMA